MSESEVRKAREVPKQLQGEDVFRDGNLPRASERVFLGFRLAPEKEVERDVGWLKEGKESSIL